MLLDITCHVRRTVHYGTRSFRILVHSGSTTGITVIIITHASLKVLEFFLLNSRSWKYLKIGQVLESPWISFHRSLKVLPFTKSNYSVAYAISATLLTNICIGLECICFTYLVICQVFFQTQDLLIIVVLSRNHCNTVHAVNFRRVLVLENATGKSLNFTTKI